MFFLGKHTLLSNDISVKLKRYAPLKNRDKLLRSKDIASIQI